MARVLLTLLIAALAGFLIASLATAFFTATHETKGIVSLAPSFVPKEKTAVVFLRGLGSSLTPDEAEEITADCRDDEAFGAIIQVLQASDNEKYGCNNILFFSYQQDALGKNGFFSEDRWIPQAYDCTETGKSLLVSRTLLRSMMSQYRDYWRERNQEVKFIVVGHSLGGLIAFQELSRLLISFDVEKVITLDSPLEGVSRRILARVVPGFGFCLTTFLGSRAAEEIANISGDPDIHNKNQEIVRQASQSQVITLGNKNDCVYWLGWCFRRPAFTLEGERHWVPRTDTIFRDNSSTQLVENAAFKNLYELGPNCGSFLECLFIADDTHTLIRALFVDIAQLIVTGSLKP